MKKTTSIIFSIFFFCNIAFSQHWVSMGEDTIGCYGASTVVYTLFSDGDSLYVGGTFRYASSACDTMWGIGIYDGQWHKMYRGVSGSEVRAIQKYKGQIYIGGGFGYAKGPAEPLFPGYAIPNTKNIARWDTINQIWEGLPNSFGEITGRVYDMTLWNDMLIIGGPFSITPQLKRIMGYNGVDYIEMGYPPSGDDVWSVVVYNNDLYIGTVGFTQGVFKYIGGTGQAAWQQIFSTSDGVLHMEVDTFNNFLYMSGFTHISDGQNVIGTSGLAMWNGFELERIGYDCAPYMHSRTFSLYRGDVYAQLWGDTICGTYPVYWFARWDGQDWHPVDGGIVGTVAATQIHKDTLYVGGGYTYVGGVPQKGLARCYAPPGGCNYLKPRVLVFDTLHYVNDTQPTATVEFFNNNAYADNWYWDFGDSHTLWSVKDPVHEFTSAGTYNVSVTVYHDTCIKTATRTITVIDNTGTEEYSRESLQFKIYPNPTDGGITVECTLPPDKEGTLRTHHSNGGLKTSHQLQPGQNTIHIPSGDLSPGISFVSLYIENRFIFSEKVVKTR